MLCLVFVFSIIVFIDFVGFLLRFSWTDSGQKLARSLAGPVRLPGKCWADPGQISQVLGQMLIRSWTEVGQIHLGKYWADPRLMLGGALTDTGQHYRCWAGAGQMFGNSCTDPVQMLGRS